MKNPPPSGTAVQQLDLGKNQENVYLQDWVQEKNSSDRETLFLSEKQKIFKAHDISNLKCRACLYFTVYVANSHHSTWTDFPEVLLMRLWSPTVYWVLRFYGEFMEWRLLEDTQPIKWDLWSKTDDGRHVLKYSKVAIFKWFPLHKPSGKFQVIFCRNLNNVFVFFSICISEKCWYFLKPII